MTTLGGVYTTGHMRKGFPGTHRPQRPKNAKSDLTPASLITSGTSRSLPSPLVDEDWLVPLTGATGTPGIFHLNLNSGAVYMP